MAERHEVLYAQLLIPGVYRYGYPPIQVFIGFILIILYKDTMRTLEVCGSQGRDEMFPPPHSALWLSICTDALTCITSSYLFPVFVIHIVRRKNLVRIVITAHQLPHKF